METTDISVVLAKSEIIHSGFSRHRLWVVVQWLGFRV